MNTISSKEKLKLIIDLCNKHGITAYQIGENTDLNTSGIHKILSGVIKNPRNKTLNKILDYIENKITGSAIPDHENYKHEANKLSVTMEEPEVYLNPGMIKLMQVMQKVGSDLLHGQEVMSAALSQTILNTDEILDQNNNHKKSIDNLSNILKNKGITFS